MTKQDMIKFSDLGLDSSIIETLDKIGYIQPTPIQVKAIPPLLEGRDLLGIAQTGTGKTAAFALPILSKITTKKTPQVLVLTPTRELAIQVTEAFKIYSKGRGIDSLTVYGGQAISVQLRQLKNGPQVIIGTPGRILDHLKRKSLKLSDIHTVILDEADEMLNMGFIEDLETILSKTPDTKQTLLFSATMPKAIARVASKYLKNNVEIKIKSQINSAENVTQYALSTNGINKLDALTRLLEIEDFDSLIIFARTKNNTVAVCDELNKRGYITGVLNGDLSQDLREKTINKFKKGDLKIVVATDVAARGLDIKTISHVINFDLPLDPEIYIHRIGRTGRAGREGISISFYGGRDNKLVQRIERTIKKHLLEFKLPSLAEVKKLSLLKLGKNLKEIIEKDPTKYDEILSTFKKEYQLSDKEIAAALLHMLTKDKFSKVSDFKDNSGDRRRGGGGGRGRSDRGRSGGRSRNGGGGGRSRNRSGGDDRRSRSRSDSRSSSGGRGRPDSRSNSESGRSSDNRRSSSRGKFSDGGSSNGNKKRSFSKNGPKKNSFSGPAGSSPKGNRSKRTFKSK